MRPGDLEFQKGWGGGNCVFPIYGKWDPPRAKLDIIAEIISVFRQNYDIAYIRPKMKIYITFLVFYRKNNYTFEVDYVQRSGHPSNATQCVTPK